MRKIRGFKIGKGLVNLCRQWVFLKRRSTFSYSRLDSSSAKSTVRNRIEKWCVWDRLKSKAKRLCSIKLGSGNTHLGLHPIEEKPVPKGHLAVYVGKKTGDGEFSRVIVPVIYFNHPLFGELLREAEKEFGYHHPGRITIPCRISEFQKIQTIIAAGTSCRRLWKKHC